LVAGQQNRKIREGEHGAKVGVARVKNATAPARQSAARRRG